jgi:hypothetical protein
MTAVKKKRIAASETSFRKDSELELHTYTLGNK